MSADWFMRWAAIGTLIAFDAACLWAKGVAFDSKPVYGALSVSAILLAVSLLSSALLRKAEKLATVLRSSSDYFYSVMQLALLAPPLIVLTYLAASVGLPLLDAAFIHTDALLGFDWPSVDAWVSSHPMLQETLRLAYDTIMWQSLGVMFLVSVERPGRANGEFIWTFLVSGVITSGLSALLPALGHDGMIGPAHIEHLNQIRAGAWTMLDLSKADGIVTFPSFHATLGVLFAYAVRQIRWAAWPLGLLNVVMIISTPTVGGHYLVDVIAGVLVAVASILLMRAISRQTARMSFRSPDFSAAALRTPLDLRR